MRRLMLVFVACTLLSSSAWANSISYQLTGNVSGTIGGVSFTNASFSLIGTGYSTGAFEIAPGIFANPLASVSVTISGIGTFQVVDPFYVYVNQSIPGAGFIDLYTGDVFDFGSNGFRSWNDISSLGPISVNGLFLAPFGTTGGLLTLSGASNLVFTAQPIATTPEPSTFGMLGIGFVGVIAAWKSRKAALAVS